MYHVQDSDKVGIWYLRSGGNMILNNRNIISHRKQQSEIGLEGLSFKYFWICIIAAGKGKLKGSYEFMAVGD